jgi:fructose/tagatose bisphosphate aldolase
MNRYFLGPMSKNVVDSVIDFNKQFDSYFAFIPSRRQVEYDGGYVNNWTTKQFREHTKDCFVTRDHAGPGQGHHDDDGYRSLSIDCKYLDMIHIDPWKKYPSFEEGLEWTTKMIKHCYNLNNSVVYEVGTEQSIREFATDELEALLMNLKINLTAQEYKKIKYCVIQSGTSLKENKNTGTYSKEKLSDMVSMVKRHELLSKEHNGDYLSTNLIKEKFNLGLDSINIAPELGLIETETYLSFIKEKRQDLLDKYFKICYTSNRWIKWVDKNFDPFNRKEELIKICGHYVLSDPEFLSTIKSNFKDVDDLVKTNVKRRLEELYYE